MCIEVGEERLSVPEHILRRPQPIHHRWARGRGEARTQWSWRRRFRLLFPVSLCEAGRSGAYFSTISSIHAASSFILAVEAFQVQGCGGIFLENTFDGFLVPGGIESDGRFLPRCGENQFFLTRGGPDLERKAPVVDSDSFRILLPVITNDKERRCLAAAKARPSTR